MEVSNLLKHVEKEYIRLWMELKLIGIIERQSFNSFSTKQLDLVGSKDSISTLLDLHAQLFDKLSQGVSSSLIEDERIDQERYLCVTDGFMIFCLDLKQQDSSKNHWKQQPIPIISSLKFSDEGYPVSVALFKVRSNAYMVGGHGFKDKYMEYLSSFYKEFAVDNSSPKTYMLSLGDDRLSLSECGTFGSLKEPKWWPIVEKIDRLVHVIESVPWWLCDAPIRPSHEVLDLDDLDQGWSKLSPKCVSHVRVLKYKEFQNHTWSHLVVGDKIFGSGCWDENGCFYTYDSKWEEWMLCRCKRSINEHRDLYSIKNMGQLVRFGSGKCVGRFVEDDNMDLYMVIGLGKEAIFDTFSAAAYLVTPAGQILCYQRLHHFFGGCLPYFEGEQGTVISVDEEEKTFCSIVQGTICRPGMAFGDAHKVLHVSTFSAEKCLGLHTACALASSLLTQASDDIDKQPLPVEKEFVKVRVKDWSAFEFKNDIGMTDGINNRKSACFL